MGLKEEVGRFGVRDDVGDEKAWFKISVKEFFLLVSYLDGFAVCVVCDVAKACMVSLYDYDEGNAKLGVIIGRNKVFVSLSDGVCLVGFAESKL